MAVPHYAYLKMKLPGPKGLITITSNYRKSLECARDGAKLAESLVIAEERRQLDRIIASAQEASASQILAEEPADEAAFKPSKETKKVKLNPEDPSCSNRLGEWALPLHQLMKKTAPFEWNDQADEAFRDPKRMLSTAPVLTAPTEKEPLLLYIAATSRSVRAVMVVERPEKDKVQAVQCPVYYLSEKLKQYFQEHVVTVVSTAPLSEIIGCWDASGRVAKWALELAGHTILYEPRTTIKSQALADFLVDWTETQYLSPPPDSTHWRMHFDGSKMRLGLGVGIVLSSPKGTRLNYRFIVQKLSGFFAGCEFLHVPRAENEAADTLAKIALSRQSIPSGVSLEHRHKPSVKPSPDSESIHVPADLAAPQPGPGTAPADPSVHQPGPGTAIADPATPQPGPGAAEPGSGAAAPEPAVVAVFAVVTAPSWALPISEFLENGVLPMDETEARQVQRRASAYIIINNKLVKRSSTGVFQCCVERDRGIEILLDIHQGECGHHAASRSLVAKAFRNGFY
ncbi:uncharacterized protein [Aegilops tauschii subsp. strangulata]|uniref:uncharacterized protein n=1 Tax=Aegilops tauschii subsp. strangulata TaxID=200361 RepID=UPI003CC8DB7E